MRTSSSRRRALPLRNWSCCSKLMRPSRSSSLMDDALRVREFWFGKSLTGSLPGEGSLGTVAQALTRRVNLWFESNPQLTAQQDELIRSEFQGLVERAARGELAAWADSPRRRLSLIILLDQFPRQIYR